MVTICKRMGEMGKVVKQRETAITMRNIDACWTRRMKTALAAWKKIYFRVPHTPLTSIRMRSVSEGRGRVNLLSGRFCPCPVGEGWVAEDAPCD